MAKGQSVGFLNFGIDGDDTAIKKKLKVIKEEAIEVDKIVRNILATQGRAGGSTQSRLIQERVNESLERQRLLQQRILTEAQRTERERQRLLSQSISGQNRLTESIGLTNKTMFNQKALLSQLTNSLGVYFSIYQAGAFVKELATISGEFEMQRKSLAAILQDGKAAETIFQQIKDLAVVSPFNFKELTGYAKQLSAFSIPTNELYDTMKRLADLSAGVGVDMGRIILAYGQVRSASVLRGQELRQFTEAGIPLVDLLADKFSKLENRVVSAGEVFDKISGREVPFEMIKEVITDLTSEGGKFFRMQEVMAESLGGKISNLRDSYDIMLDSIGSANEGLLKGSVDGINHVMENWERYWAVLKGIIVTYGAYKAAVIALNIAEQITIYGNLTKAIQSTTIAQRLLNSAVLKNPYVAVIAIVAGLVTLMWSLKDSTSAAAQAQEEYNKIKEEAADAEANHRSEIEKLINTATNQYLADMERVGALEKLKNKYPEIFHQYDIETLKLADILSIKKQIAEIDAKETANNRKEAYEKAKREVELATENLEKAQRAPTMRLEQTKRAQEQLDKAKNSLLLYYKDVQEDRVNGFIADIKKLTNGQLEAELKARERLKKRLDEEGKDAIGTIKGGEAWGNFNSKELESQTSAIKAELDKRNEATFSYTELQKKYTNELQTLETKRKNLLASNDKKNATDLKEELSNLDKDIETKKQQLKDAGVDLKKKPKSSQKDPFTDRLKEQIDLIKQAKTEYDKLLKIMSPSDAGVELKKIDAYKNVDLEKISKTGYVSYLEDVLQKLDVRGTDTAKKLAATIRKEIGTGAIEQVVEDSKKAVESIEKYLSQYKDKYDLYEKIFGITGDKGRAARLAFGNTEEAVKSYIEVMKDQLKNMPNGLSYDDIIKLDDTSDLNSDVKKLFEKIESAVNDESSKIKTDALQVLNDFGKLEDRITAIQAKYEKLREDAAKENLGQDVLDAYSKKEEEEIDKLKEELFTLTDYYRKIFGDMSEITFNGLKEMVVKGEAILKTATPNYDKDNKLKSYTVTTNEGQYNIPIQAFDRFSKKITELRQKVNAEDPFSAILSNINKLKSGDLTVAAFAKAVTKNLGDIMNIANDVGQSISNMLSAFGNDDGADAVGFALELGGTFANMAQDIASGNPVQQITGVVKGVTGIISSIANFHDKKLDKAIKRSQAEVKRLQNSYSELSRFIQRQLGAITQKQSEEQINNLKKQQAELERQMAAEQKKKKKSPAAIEDYKNSISEIKDQIRYYYEDLLKELYNFDFKSIADNLSSALVEAFKKGESAAKAFDNTVGDIINKLATDMISLQVIQPAMDKLRDYLFGDKGVFNDGELSVSDAQGLVSQLMGLKDKIGDAKDIWDALNDAAKQAGIDLGASSSKDTLSKGIQALTEDTGNLLASYLNAIRADVAAQRAMIQQYLLLAQRNSDTFALQLAELVKIQINTLATANNTNRLVELSESTNKILINATTEGSGIRLNL